MIVSTIAELEHVLPTLKRLQAEGRQVNVLYGIPPPSSQIPRLSLLARQLGPGTVSVLIDNARQLDHVEKFFMEAGFAAEVFLKVDTGYHRAGLPPASLNKDDLIPQLLCLQEHGKAKFLGLYSHSSLSYSDTTVEKAMMNLKAEIDGCLEVLALHKEMIPQGHKFVISVGASPQVTSIESLLHTQTSESSEATGLRQTLHRVQQSPHGFSTTLELHAGVYALSDMQQLSTHSREAPLDQFESEIAVSVLAEIISIYNDGERDQPEALAAVGTLGLGREPCPSYSGWGVVGSYSFEAERRLIVTRISQEHSIIAWEQQQGEDSKSLPPIPLEIGQTVRIYPNHACVTGAMYASYLVVDSSDNSEGTVVVDEWRRARGW